MRVTFGTQDAGLAALRTAATEMAQAQREVASGRRVSVASDDPLAARKIISERAEMATIDAYRRSADSAAARLAAADASLNGMIEQLTQALSTAAAGRGSTADAQARQAIAASIRGVRAGLLTQVNTEFNGRPLFAGSAAEGPAYADVAGTWTYTGATETVQLEVQRGRMVTVAFDGQSVLQGADAQNILTSLDDLAAAIEAADELGISDGMQAIERAMARATRAQGQLGSDEQGLDDAISQLTSLRLASETRRSRAQDADLAVTITRMNQAETAYRAALGAVGTAERLTLLDYLR